MSNMDDFLASMGIAPEEPPQSSQQLLGDAEPTVTVPEQLQQTHELTASDFNDILDDLGFNPPDAEAEEITEEEGTLQEVQTAAVSDHVHPQTLDGQWEEEPVESDDDGFIPVTEDTAQAVQESLSTIQATVSDNSEPTVEDAPSEPLIPENSPTLTTDVSTSRFSGAEWYELTKEQQIIIGGCGGISSWLAFQVARLSPETIVIYDDDIVELGNLSGQLFSRFDVNRTKVEAIKSLISEYNEHYCVHSIPSRFTASTESGNIMMCGFDNMEAREIFFRSWRRHVASLPEERRKECLFLDGRLSINVLQVFCITGDDVYNIARYGEEFLFDDADADETVCSMKQTTYMACMIGSIMTNLFVNFVANLTDPVLPYDLPFFTEYDAQNMIFKTEK